MHVLSSTILIIHTMHECPNPSLSKSLSICNLIIFNFPMYSIEFDVDNLIHGCYIDMANTTDASATLYDDPYT